MVEKGKEFFEDAGAVEVGPKLENRIDQLKPKAEISMEQAEKILKGFSEKNLLGSEIPDCGRLSNLDKTRQSWRDNRDGTQTFNFPEKTGEKLDSAQGIPGFRGTCALASAVNVLRLAGGNIDEKTLVQYAAEKGYCSTGGHETTNGGVRNMDVVSKLLAECKLSCHTEAQSVPALAKAVSEGHGVIVVVNAYKLWNSPFGGYGPHAITVTSVTRGTDDKIVGFHVCDSGTGGADASKFYSRGQLEAALLFQHKMCVTDNVIR